MLKILIAIPTFENILPETFKSVYGLERPADTVLQFDFVKGYDCARARNLIAKEALEYGFDYVLMVDSDIILPSNALTSMLSDPKELCLGCYPRKNTDKGKVELFHTGQRDFVKTFTFDELGKIEGKFRVKGGGFGCALINVALFKSLPYPWFKYVEYDNASVLSEDNYFCLQVSNAGHAIYADPDVVCGHSVRKFQWR